MTDTLIKIRQFPVFFRIVHWLIIGCICLWLILLANFTEIFGGGLWLVNTDQRLFFANLLWILPLFIYVFTVMVSEKHWRLILMLMLLILPIYGIFFGSSTGRFFDTAFKIFDRLALPKLGTERRRAMQGEQVVYEYQVPKVGLVTRKETVLSPDLLWVHTLKVED